MRFCLSRQAEQDLVEIARESQRRWGRAKRIEYIAKLDNSFQRLGNNPELGRSCDHIRLGYRCLDVGSHTVFYKLRTNQKNLFIVRILHQRMEHAHHL